MTRSSETGFLGGSTSVRAAKHRAGNPSVRRSSPGARRRLSPKIHSEKNIVNLWVTYVWNLVAKIFWLKFTLLTKQKHYYWLLKVTWRKFGVASTYAVF